jgi:hypothetical protein
MRDEFLDLSDEQERRLLTQYTALYIDGYKGAPTGNATTSLLTDSVHILVEAQDAYFKTQFSYEGVELVSVTYERSHCPQNLFGRPITRILAQKANT